MKKILTFDIGTTSVKTTLFNEDLKAVAYSNEEYELITGGKGIVELEAEKYWEAVKSGIESIFRNSDINREDICVIAVTTQGETLIPLDSEGNALRNAIVWLDGRAAKESEFINEKYSKEKFYSRTGIPECTGLCPVSKLLWIKNNEPDVYKNTYKFMLLEDYIIYKLTGRFVTEKSLLCTTGYFDIQTDELWDEMLESIKIDKDKIPEPLECGEIVGPLTKGAAAFLGLREDTLVATAAMDQTAGAVGAGNLFPGIVTETTGTALGLAATAENPDFNEPLRVILYRHIYKNLYLYLPVCMTAGIVLKWFRDEFCMEEFKQGAREGRSVYAILDEIVENTPPLSNGLVLLPYFTGVIQPDNNPLAKGVFFGVGLETKRNHFIRSIFEAVAYLLRENIELVESIIKTDINEIRSLGGGSNSKVWLKIKSDVNGKRIVSMVENECTSLGAAILGAVAIGMFESAEKAAATANGIKDRYTPDPVLTEQYDEGYATYREIYLRLKTLFK